MEISRSNVTRFLSKCEYTLKGLWHDVHTRHGTELEDQLEDTADALDNTRQGKFQLDESKSVGWRYDPTERRLAEKVNLPSYKIKLTPYAKTFYTEWLLKPDSYQYNMLSADQILYGQLDVARLRAALKRYVTDHLLLNSHIQATNGEPYWVKNPTVSKLEYSIDETSEAELLDYVKRPFDLYCGPLYRFKLIRLNDGAYRFIIVLHHLVMDSISINEGLFDMLSNYYNDPSYTIEHNAAAQIELLTNLEQKLSAKLEQHREAYQNFWQQQLADAESIDLNFLRAPSAAQVA